MAEMPFGLRSRCNWKLRTRSLALGERTVVMGVLNTTPDSFSDGGAFSTPAAGIEYALAMFEEGADIVDIGGESTRPGKRRPVTVQEEIDRVIPVVEGVLRHRPDAILSIDTYKAQTAASALAAGVEIVNDVSGFLWDEEMSRVCVAAGCGVVLMHTRGRPEAVADAASTCNRKKLYPWSCGGCGRGCKGHWTRESSGNGLFSTQDSALGLSSSKITRYWRVLKS